MRVLMSSLRKSERQTIRRNYKDLHESRFNISVSITIEDEKLDTAERGADPVEDSGDAELLEVQAALSAKEEEKK